MTATRIGSYFELSGSRMTHYDYAASRLIGLRGEGAVSFVLSDHLGSPSTLVGVGGELQASRRYTAWGETRLASGASGLGVGYTGQEQAVGLGGLHDYGARWFDPLLGRFLSPDSLVPDPYQPLDWDRYSYTRNNPIRYTDPTGHYVASADEGEGTCRDSLDCVYPEGHEQAGELIISPSKKERKQGAQFLGTGLALVPGLDTEDDVLIQKPTPVTDYVKDSIPWSSTTWGSVSTTLDVLAWMTDAYAAGVVTYGGIAGAGITSPFITVGLPEVPVASGWAGAAIAELYVQPTLRLGNILATASTTATYISETKAGRTVIETGQISNVTKNSVSLTVLGWAAPSEAYISFIFQSTAVLNDFGVISVPFR